MQNYKVYKWQCIKGLGMLAKIINRKVKGLINKKILTLFVWFI